jgi:hypothetical protein
MFTIFMYSNIVTCFFMDAEAGSRVLKLGYGLRTSENFVLRCIFRYKRKAAAAAEWSEVGASQFDL